ncbi:MULTISPECIES: EAL domain-containing protein [Acidobacteriaceae]|uniref:EAL domain-containing protein n=1 Tax=Acidobacteriaceae TaxID=204434 RepID=UPI00131D549B|nr:MULTISPECIES: EAL domain-containing protein [Acidobacteriaceae]MDW5266216.1 EAL domain-containing protein [Edaphobacter sp.]
MAIKRSELKSELKKALKHAEIVPFFQPMVGIRTGKLVGFEVLARWLHPQRGTIRPDEFIPVAEETGLIGELTETILLQAFAATTALQKDLNISVNISPIQLRDPSLPDEIRRAAEMAAFPLHRLTVEITESALVDNLELAASIASRLKSLGVKLALDDFGTGYSSLRNLQALPFDELKVDRSFVSSMIQSRDSRKIVAAVIGLGQSLKLTTVAEGIENETQADILRWLGCDVGQGWLYGPPVAERDLPKVIAAPMSTATHTLHDSPASDLITCIEPLPSQRLAQLQAIYDGAPVALAFVDADLRYVSVNQRLASLSGISVEEHLGQKLSEVMPPAIYSQIEPYLLRALKGEAITGLEVTQPAIFGESKSVTYLISHQPAWDEGGEVIGVSVAIVDITDRMRVIQALRASKEHYRHMVELNPHMPWIMEPSGKVIEVSPHWEEFTGQTTDQTLSSGWRNAVHPQDLERMLPILLASLQSGDPFDIEHRIGTRDGSWRWVRARGNALRSEDGTILRWYGSTEDVEDYMKLKQKLSETEAKLAALLEEKKQRS